MFLLEPAYYFAGSSLIFCYNRPWSFSLLNLLLLEPAHIFAGSWYFFLLQPLELFLLEPGQQKATSSTAGDGDDGLRCCIQGSPATTVIIGFCYNRCQNLLQPLLIFLQPVYLHFCYIAQASVWIFCYNRCSILLERALVFAGTGDRDVTTVRCD